MLWVSPALTVYICVLTGILGACMGSFLNCMAWRIVHGESVLHGRSHCDVCGHVLGAGDLIPVLSYIMHKDRCKYCGARLSAGHVFAEVLTALTFLLLVLKYDISLQALEYILLACLLLAAAFTDLEGYMIPDRFIVTGIVVRVVFLFLQGNVLENLMDALLGGFAVGGGLLLIVLLYEKVRQKEAMGGGDIKLLFLTGLFLGWQRNILCLLIACVLGIVFAFIFPEKRTTEDGAEEEDGKLFPWGPSISAAAILTLLCGSEIIGVYLSLF